MEEKELSPEEIISRREEMMKYYDEHIPFLAKQLEYEMLITQLQESQMRRLRAMEMIANITAPSPEPEKETKERQLKKS